MYSVSADYLTALSAPVKKFRLTGSVGSYSFTQANIIENTFSIVNRVSEGSEVKLGSVYIGQLKATFTGLNIARGAWLGKVITVSEGLQLADESYEDVPLGVFTIAEANHTAFGVEVIAYDNMTAFDTAAQFNTIFGAPYDILGYICTQCGVTLGNTQAQIESLPNGSESLYLSSINDIRSFRDMIYWLAQTLCAIATINRSGYLELRQYSTTSAQTIDESHRFEGCSFSDFVTRYTGMSVVDSEGQQTRYYHVEPDDGLVYNLGENPFVQNQFSLVQNIIYSFADVELTPFKATMLGGALYDLGDCLTFSGGIAQGAVCGVMSYSYNYNRGYSIEGYGDNPALANAKSRTDNDIAGIISRIDNDTISHLIYTNASDITLADGDEEQIATFRFDGRDGGWIVLNADIWHTAETTSTETASLFTDTDLQITAKLYLNSVLQPCTPTQTEQDGYRLFHIGDSFYASQGINRLEIYLKCIGGSITIPNGYLRGYIIGNGVANATSEWDGLIELHEQISNIPIPDVQIQSVSDNLVVYVRTTSARINTSSVVTRDQTYTTIAGGVFEMQTEYTETSSAVTVDTGYCTKVTPYITGLTVSDVEIA